jgi:hypothetical protein
VRGTVLVPSEWSIYCDDEFINNIFTYMFIMHSKLTTAPEIFSQNMMGEFPVHKPTARESHNLVI